MARLGVLAAAVATAAAAHLAEMVKPHARGGFMYHDLKAKQERELAVQRELLGLPEGWAPNATVNLKASLLDNKNPASATYQQVGERGRDGVSRTPRRCRPSFPPFACSRPPPHALQPFYFDTTFCSNGTAGISACWTTAPVIMEMGGEWTVSSGTTGAVNELASRLGAVTVYLQHRFYGQAWPVPGTYDKASMQSYLSVPQAIHDSAGACVCAQGGGGRA